MHSSLSQDFSRQNQQQLVKASPKAFGKGNHKTNTSVRLSSAMLSANHTCCVPNSELCLWTLTTDYTLTESGRTVPSVPWPLSALCPRWSLTSVDPLPLSLSVRGRPTLVCIMERGNISPAGEPRERADRAPALLHAATKLQYHSMVTTQCSTMSTNH